MEVERLKGLVSGGGSGSSAGSSSSAFGRGPTPSIPKQQATAASIQKQRAQLAEMGVSIPSEFRSDMAMPGEWQVTAERVIDPEGEEKKPEALALGVRKRVVGEEEEELNEAKKRRWGSTYRTHPTEEEDNDLDTLLSNATRKGKEPETKVETKVEVKEEASDPPGIPEPTSEGALPVSAVKTESPSGLDGQDEAEAAKVLDSIPPISEAKPEIEDLIAPGVVFKKRKAKNIRQK